MASVSGAECSGVADAAVPPECEGAPSAADGADAQQLVAGVEERRCGRIVAGAVRTCAAKAEWPGRELSAPERKRCWRRWGRRMVRGRSSEDVAGRTGLDQVRVAPTRGLRRSGGGGRADLDMMTAGVRGGTSTGTGWRRLWMRMTGYVRAPRMRGGKGQLAGVGGGWSRDTMG